MEFVGHDDRMILILRQWEGLSFGEIGTQLGITPNTAGMRCRRAVERLAKVVGRLRRGNTAALIEDSEK